MSTPQRSDPTVPGELDLGFFGTAKMAVVNVNGGTSESAWKRLMTALSRDLQGGLHRAHNATLRLQRMR